MLMNELPTRAECVSSSEIIYNMFLNSAHHKRSSNYWEGPKQGHPRINKHSIDDSLFIRNHVSQVSKVAINRN